MEKNLENKAKFFALYWGQRVLFEHTSLVNEFSIVEYLEDSYLELVQLSQITDEHALEISKICYRGIESHTVEAGKNIAFGIVKDYAILHVGEVIIFVTDFLRYKRYALPYMGLSVEQLVSFGWVKLKEVRS